MLTEGECIPEHHLLGRSSFVLIGADAADSLFECHDGITGETIRIDGQPFRILGVLESRGNAIESRDNRVIIPLSKPQVRWMKCNSPSEMDMVFVQAVMLAIFFSAAIGLFLGIYPANRAAGLEPVDALRYEYIVNR